MGCHTEPEAVHIAHVLQRLHFFQNFFFSIYTTYRTKKLHALTAKKKINFFYNLHDLAQKNYMNLPQKKITRLDNFFYTTYIFHRISSFSGFL